MAPPFPRKTIQTDLTPGIKPPGTAMSPIPSAPMSELGTPLTADEQLNKINRALEIQTAPLIIGTGFIGTEFLVTNNPMRVVTRAKQPRNYLFINMTDPGGSNSNATFFPLLLRAPGAYNSTTFDVTASMQAALFLQITANAGGGTLVIDALSVDPVSGIEFVTQPDVFAGASAIGTYYADLGELGIDNVLSLLATVGVADITFSVGGVIKGGFPVFNSNTIIFIGSNDVSPQSGFPLLPGQKQSFFLLDNVDLFGVTGNLAASLPLRIFQQQ